MTTKTEVQIRIESQSPDQQVVQSVDAELYRKGDSFYYRYAEPDPTMGDTMTTVKVKNEQVKVMRHGGLQSEQTFTNQQQEWGFYQMAEGKLSLETRTESIAIQLNDIGHGTVAWSYDLYITGEFAGQFKIKLDIQGDIKA